MTKFYLVIVVLAILFASCLKQSIPDAMLDSQNSSKNSATATLSYIINGTAVNISVADADNPPAGDYTLGCNKNPGYYAIEGESDNFGEFAFAFYTDSLTLWNYKYTVADGYMYFIRYNGTD